MIMPVDRTGENPLWNDPEPYYDDYYAIWDTYRTSTPLITLIDPQRETDIVRSLLTIYKRDGYMPDARSGNANGRTQGGSNAEIVIADAFVKGLKGIDYELALKAMLQDATVPPGGNQEAEGRGGLVPPGIGLHPPRHPTCRKPYRRIRVLRLCHRPGGKRIGQRRPLPAIHETIGQLEKPVAERLRARRSKRLHHAARQGRELAGPASFRKLKSTETYLYLYTGHLRRTVVTVVHPVVGHVLLRSQLVGILAQHPSRCAGAYRTVRRKREIRRTP